MRPYLAVLKDSFREALASRVLLVTLIGIAVVLLVLSPFGLETTTSTELRRSELVRPERLLAQLEEAANEPDSPRGHLLSLLSDEQRERLDALADPDQDQRPRRRRGPNPQKRRLVDLLNELLEHPDFYDPDVWTRSSASDELTQLTEQSSLTEAEQRRRNLLLMAVTFPSAIDIVDSSAISLSYASQVVQGPMPFTADQFAELFDQVLVAVVSVFLGFFGVFGCLLVTAGQVPRTFEPGEISLLLSKPVNRSLLFLVRFVGGCAFTLLYSATLVIGIWTLLGVRLGFWRHELLWCIPVYVFLFMIYYAVSAVAGAVWRNSIVALALVVVFWLVLTVVGTTREALHENLIEERGIKEIVNTGTDVLTIDGNRNTWLWNSDTTAWRQIFREPPGRIGALARMLMGSGARGVPVYDAANDRILAIHQTQSRFGGFGTSKLLAASADDDWERQELAEIPEPVPNVLISRRGRVILPARRSIYEFVGQSDAVRQRSEFLNRISGGLLGKTRSGFHEIHADDWPDLGEKFAAALDPVSEDLLLYGNGLLCRMVSNEDERYSLKQSRQLDTASDALVAAAGDFVMLALRSGQILVLGRETLETVDELRLPDGVRPRRCVASRDGTGLAALTHNGTLLLFDTGSKQLREWRHPQAQGSAAVAWSLDNNLMVSDGRLAVQEFALRNTLSELVREWSEPTTWVYQLYDYSIDPAWTVLPKPSRLDALVSWVVSRESKDDSGDAKSPDTREFRDRSLHDASFDPVPVLRDNALFVVVLLALGCIYVRRCDY